MDNLPISNYVKTYYREHNIVLDDFTRATIIWNSHLGLHEEISMLREIAENTTDGGLKQQIVDRLAYEESIQKLFKENPDGKYIYKVTEYDDGSGQYYFNSYKLAVDYGKKNCESTIYIEKIIINSEEHNIAAYCRLDKTGEKVLNFSSYYPPFFIEEYYGKNSRFEDAFYPFEFPFERGDIVRDVTTGIIGVLETSREEWVRLFPKIMSGELYADASDNVVSVEYIGDDGEVYYEHISFLDLEKVTEFESKEQEELMRSISMLLQGKEMLWSYTYYLERYVNKMKEM